MWYYFGICCLVFVLLSTPVLAEDDVPAVPTLPTVQNDQIPSVEQANRFLSAEATKAIKNSQDELLEALIANQDSNTLQLDLEMRNLMNDIRMKVILGVLGVILLAQGIAAYFLVTSFKNNSYERFLESQVALAESKDVLKTSPTARELSGVVEQQQQEWQPQAPPQSFGTQIGQSAASQQTMANQWQTEPVYAGAWESPVQAQPDPQEANLFEQTANEFVEMTQPPHEEYPAPDMNQYQDPNQQYNQY